MKSSFPSSGVAGFFGGVADRSRSYLRMRPVWWAGLAVVGLAMLLLAMVGWWGWLYAEGRMDLWWPALYVGLAWFFYWAGQRCHLRAGQPQYFPWSAVLVAMLCLVFLGTMLDLFGSTWSWGWCVPALFAIGVASHGLANAVIAYTEWWRVFDHPRVREKVEELVDSGASGKRILLGDPWGSPHGLRLLKQIYEDRRETCLSRSGKRRPEVVSTLMAGDAYLAHLGSRWSKVVLTDAWRDWERRNTARELLTLCVAGTRVLRQQHREDIARWMQVLKSAPDDFHRFLVVCFELGTQATQDARRAPQILASVRRLYATASSSVERPEGVRLNAAAVLQNTWLAFAHRGIPAQAAFDLWMTIRREGAHGPLLFPESREAVDPSYAAARSFLQRHYAAWAGNSSPAWNAGLKARARWHSEEVVRHA